MTPSLKSDLFDLIIGSAAEGICMHEDSAEPPFVRFTVWNERMTEITGYTVQEINQIGWAAALYPDATVRADVVHRFERSRTGECLTNLERVITRKDGAMAHILVSTRLLVQPNGKRCTVAMLRDVTQRKQAETELARANRRLAVHMETTPLALVEFDANKRIVRWSKTSERMFGWAAEEMVGSHLDDHALIHEEDVGPVMEQIGPVLNGHIDQNHVVNRNRTKDGRVLHCHWYNSAVRNECGEIETFLGMAHDITEQTEAQKAARESQRTMATLLGNLPGIAYRCLNDARWTMVFVSEGSLELTGYTPEELIGNARTSFEEIVHAEDRNRIRADIEQALLQRRRFEITYRMVTASGAVKWVWERGTGIFADDGTLLFIEGFVTDVTRQKLLEEQLRHAQKMESIGRLAGGVAHDFNNILTVIEGHAGLLLESTDVPEPMLESVQEIYKAAERAANLTRQLLTFSRRQVMQTRELDLNDVTADVLKMLTRILGEDISLEYRPANEPALIYADMTMLHQVLMNLAVNARDAMPSGGRLSMKVRTRADVPGTVTGSKGSWVCLEVADTGFGIPEEHLPRIFEPFFTTKDVGKGSGLGLATVYGIVEQHGGVVQVCSEPGRGTVFSVYLPQARVS